MINKRLNQEPNDKKNSVEKRTSQSTESRFWTQLEQIDRQRLKFEKMQAHEEKLTALSKLEFQDVDYQALIARIPWQAWPIPDFSYLVEEARITTESKYFLPVVMRGVLLAVLAVIWLASSQIILLWVSGTIILTLAVSLVLTVNERSNAIIQAVCDAHLEMENKKNAEIEKLEQARLLHEQAEDERIEQVKKLLEGDIGSVALRLEEIFKQKTLPFYLNIDIDLYNNIPIVKIWLPDKTVIPIQEATLLSNGRVNYKDKDVREVNRQYIEVCAAVIMQITTFIYINIPSFDNGYATGLIEGETDNVCLFNVKVNREKLKDACQAPSGIVAMQKLQAEFSSDSFLNLIPLQMLTPAEWQDVEQKSIRNFKFKILHRN